MRRRLILFVALCLLFAPGARALRMGDSGDEVLRLTRRLQELMYLTEESDTYDRTVAGAVRAFRADAGLGRSGSTDENVERVLFGDEVWRTRLESLPAPDLSGAAKAMSAAVKTLGESQSDDGGLLLNAESYGSAFELTLVRDWRICLQIVLVLQEDVPLYSGETLKATLRGTLPAQPRSGLVRLSGNSGGWEAVCAEGTFSVDLLLEGGVRQALLDGSLTLAWRGEEGRETAALTDWEPLSGKIPACLAQVWESLDEEEISFRTACAERCREHLPE